MAARYKEHHLDQLSDLLDQACDEWLHHDYTPEEYAAVLAEDVFRGDQSLIQALRETVPLEVADDVAATLWEYHNLHPSFCTNFKLCGLWMVEWARQTLEEGEIV